MGKEGGRGKEAAEGEGGGRTQDARVARPVAFVQLHLWSSFYILTPTHPYVGWGVGDLRNKRKTLSEAEFKEMGLASEREARAG